MKEFYSILGVSENASQDDIKKAYRKLAKQFHPDKNLDNPQASARFKEISEAYETLGDPHKREDYDFGSQGVGFDPFDGFGDIFSNIFGERQRKRKPVEYDVDVGITLSFEEAALGCEKFVSYKVAESCVGCSGSGCTPGTSRVACGSCGGNGRVQMKQGFMSVVVTCPTCKGDGSRIDSPCSDCSGSGVTYHPREINASIPPGVHSKNVITYDGEGHSTGRGSISRGSLNLHISVLGSSDFYRKNLDIIGEKDIDYVDLVLGGKVDVKTIHGTLSISIPAGTQVGSYLKIKGNGIRASGIGNGDHLLHVGVVIPKNISDEQRDILKQFREKV